MQCVNCQAENELHHKFCTTCGKPLKVLCPECEFTNEPGAKFCGGCGNPLQARSDSKKPATGQAVERRQVTVLFADLSGFTKLTNQLDSEDVHAIMRRYFEVVDALVLRYGGTTTRHLGDAVMAIFGVPRAHTDDAERALHVAIGIHLAMEDLSEEFGREFTVHIGVASGEVVVGAKDSGYSVTGESVNLASRLYDMAGPCETLLSDATWRAVEQQADCQSVGDIDVKGFVKPVTVRRLIKLDPGIRRRDRKPIVGRRMELSQLESMVQICKSAEHGQTMLIRGEAGIGKTRLLDELINLARQEGFLTHVGLILDFGVEANQDPIRVAVQSLLGINSGDGEQAIEGVIDKAIDDQILDESHRIYLNDLIGLTQSSELRKLFDAMDNDLRIKGRHQTVARLLQSVSRQQPLLLAFEDIQWADPVLLDSITCISNLASECRMLLVMTSRVEGNPASSGWYGGSLVTIDLAALGADDAIKLAANFFDASSRMVKDCVERAAGNPLFLEQLLRSTDDAVSGELPGSVLSIVMARMDQLDVSDRQAIQAASVIGQRFEPGLLRHLIEQAEFDCHSLVIHQLLHPDAGGYLFAHALVREGVYSSLLKDQRRQLHARAADWYADRDPTLHAEHLERADDATAALAYLQAARNEAAAFRFETAMSLLDRGQALATRTDHRYALARYRGGMLHHLGSIDAALEACELALSLAADDAQRCPVWIELSACLSVVDRYQESLGMLEKAEAVARRNNSEIELARIHHRRGNIYFPLGNIDGCLEQHHEACRLGIKLHDAEIEANALSGLGDANYQRGRMVKAAEHYARCMEISHAQGFGRIEFANRHMLGLTRYYLGQTSNALQDCQAGAGAAAQAGQQRAEMAARCSMGPILVDLERPDEAYAESEAGLALARSLGARRFEPLSLITMARVEFAAGDTQAAMVKLGNAIEISRETGASFTGPWVLGATASITRDPDAALALLDEAEALLNKGCLAHNYLWFYRDAMDVCLRYEQWPRLDQYIEALVSFTEAEPLPWSDFFIERARVLARYMRSEEKQSIQRQLESLHRRAHQLSLTAECKIIGDMLETE